MITGITGQDGSYLAELLLEKGYEVHGVVRGAPDRRLESLAHIEDRVVFHRADLLDQPSMVTALREAEPREVYNLAAQSSVSQSWSEPLSTGESTALGVARLLEAIRTVDPSIRFYQASSSDMYGDVLEVPQSERTPFSPRTPYGTAKLYGHFITLSYRERYGLFCVSGILFNHESPRRGRDFVTRHVSHGVARIALGLDDHLPIGNVNAERDWGFAGDYVESMWRMLRADEPVDYVIGTGVAHSVQDLIEIAFDHAGLAWEKYVRVDAERLRPAEAERLVADPSRARDELGWVPSVEFEELVKMMVDADMERLKERAGRAETMDVGKRA